MAAMQSISPSAAQPVAQSTAVAACLRLDANPPSGFDDGPRKVWIDTCRQAVAEDTGNARMKFALARALGADGQRAEAVKLWRELGAQNNAAALFEIFDDYKSFERGDVDRPHVITRGEAEQALRKAAELGHASSILMLAVLLDRGTIVKRDTREAIRWAERAVDNPAPGTRPVDMQVLLGRLLVKSDDADKARGIELLGKLAQAGRSDAKAYLATAIRASDPVQARALLEQALGGAGGAAIPLLADMLIKGEGGPADPKHALSLLSGRLAFDVPEVQGALGQLYLEGKLVPRDLKQGVRLLRIWAGWDYDARLQLMDVLAANPELTITYPGGILYDATEAVELGEPGAMHALIALKLSASSQFSDKAGGCALASRAAREGDALAARRLAECN